MKSIPQRVEILVAIKEDFIPNINSIQGTPEQYLSDFYARNQHLDGSHEQIKLYLPFVSELFQVYIN